MTKLGKLGADALELHVPDPATTALLLEEWKARPVLLLRLHTKNGDIADTDEFYSSLRSEIGRLGRTLDDIAMRTSHSSDVARYAWSRNVKWKSLPIIGDPVYELNYADASLLSQADGWDKRSMDITDVSVGSGRLSGRAPDLFIISGAMAPKDLHEAIAILKKEHPGAEPSIMHFDGKYLREVHADEIAAAYRKHYPHDRFVYNHAVNLLILGGRAYLKVSRDRGYRQQHVEEWAPRLDSFHWRLGHPLCIQMLFEIQRHGGGKPVMWLRDAPQQREWVWANGSTVFEKAEEGDLFSWKGSGRYPAWEELVSPSIPEHEVHIKGTDYKRSYVDTILYLMSPLGYVDFICADAEGRICLSGKGRAYLELLGPALSDPDVLLRWRTEDGLFCTMEDVPSVDRWLNRAFRKVKRAVAGLPASPVTEETEEKWPEMKPHVLLVRGRKVAVTEEMMLDPAFAAEVERIEREQPAQVSGQQRFGVVRDDLGYGAGGSVKAIWAGFPLAVVGDRYKDIACYELFADWEETDASISKLELPACFSGGTGGIETLAFEAPYSATETFLEPKRCEVDEDTAWPVVYGRSLQIALPIRNEDLERTVRFQRMGAGLMGRQPDGARVHGSRKGGRVCSVSIGVQVGAFDQKTSSLVLETSWCRMRSDLVGRMFRKRGPDEPMQAVLGHPDLSPEGYWMMRPDGVAVDLTPVVEKIKAAQKA